MTIERYAERAQELSLRGKLFFEELEWGSALTIGRRDICFSLAFKELLDQFRWSSGRLMVSI